MVERQDFDSEAFECSFWRVTDPGSGSLVEDVHGARSAGADIIDAKVPAGDVENMQRLLSLGFRRVCMQVGLRAPAASSPSSAVGVAVDPELALPVADIDRHAANFTRDRFALDPLLPSRGHNRLFRAWITNSLGGRREVAHVDGGFCTFADRGDDLVIDLLSVLHPGQGLGSRLVRGVLCEAGMRARGGVTVVTECENPAALRTYRRSGFDITNFDLALHWCRVPV